MMKKTTLTILSTLLLAALSLHAQKNTDWREIKNGHFIHEDGYVDQPYVSVLEDGTWFCVYTTNDSHEGSGGQHIAGRLSDDHGKTWSEEVKIENPGPESKSWGMPYLTPYGRIYVFYVYNGDKIHSLGDKNNIREDMLGWYCYKYSDDRGKTWSKRYRIPLRKTSIDFMNQWNGNVQIFWGVGKPLSVDKGMVLGFTKVGKYMLEYSEGWLIYSHNIDREKEPEKLSWELLPEGDKGIRSPFGGDIQEEHNMVKMNNGDLYCIYRTTQGYPMTSYSDDGGRTWTMPEIPLYYTGKIVKNPRANPRVWKVRDKYLLWYHNNGTRTFNNRNPAWVSGGIEKDGKVIWSQPEILFYDKNTSSRMSYPDLIYSGNDFWITETQKSVARTHEVPGEFLEKLWSQFTIDQPVEDKPVWHLESLNDTIETTPFEVGKGFTITARLKDNMYLGLGTSIFSLISSDSTSLHLEIGEFGSVVLRKSTGSEEKFWESDRNFLQTQSGREQEVSVVIDNNAGIITFINDGILSDGDQHRAFGWGRIDLDPNIQFQKYLPGTTRITRTELIIYERPLMTTEVIGNYRFWRNN